MPAWNDMLRTVRREQHLSQQALATRAEISVSSLSRVELGKSRPTHPQLLRLCQALGLDRTRTNALLTATGFDPLPTGELTRIEERRGSLEWMQREIDGYPWPCLVQNDRSEIVLWNASAERVAELDFARDLPNLQQRNLMRIAAMPHFRERVQNWSEVVGAMIAMFKGTPSMDIGAPGGLSPYYIQVVADLAQQHPHVLQEMLVLWQQPAWADAARVVFPARWRLANGTQLSFDCIFSQWSLFDSISTIDWFPADQGTCRWLHTVTASPLSPEPHGPGKTVPRTPWNQLLRMGREGTGLTRQDVANALGDIAVDTLKSYERGRRRPDRQTVLRLAWAMELDGATCNAILTGLRYEPEPSEWSRLILGQPAQTRVLRDAPWADRITRAHQRMSEHVAGHRWPCLLVSEECSIIAANPAMNRLLGELGFRNGRERTLIQVMLSDFVRGSLVNWYEVVTALLPVSLKQALSNGDTSALPPRLREVAVNAQQKESQSLPWLETAALRGSERISEYRLVVPLYWRSVDDRVLSFICVLSLWSGIDTIWALDWHPTDGDTWAWLEHVR